MGVEERIILFCHGPYCLAFLSSPHRDRLGWEAKQRGCVSARMQMQRKLLQDEDDGSDTSYYITVCRLLRERKLLLKDTADLGKDSL